MLRVWWWWCGRGYVGRRRRRLRPGEDPDRQRNRTALTVGVCGDRWCGAGRDGRFIGVIDDGVGGWCDWLRRRRCGEIRVVVGRGVWGLRYSCGRSAGRGVFGLIIESDLNRVVVPWHRIDAVRVRRGIAVLTITGPKAKILLPAELLPDELHARIHARARNPRRV